MDRFYWSIRLGGMKLALKCDVELDSGLLVKGAYHRITNFYGTESQISFSVNVYINKEAFEKEKPSITSKTFETTFDKDRNLFSQMYEYLRTLSEYDEAVEA